MLLFNQIVALAGTLIGGVEDLRTFEVPDWLNYSMMFIGVGSALIFSTFRNDFDILLSSLAGLAACFLLGCLMFYTGQWGGGDAKMLMGLGALVGLDVTMMNEIPFLLLLLVNTFIFGALWGLIYSLYLAWSKRDKFKKEFRKRLYSDQVTLIRKVNLVVTLGLAVALFFVPFRFRVLMAGIIIFLYASLYMWVFVKSVEKACMVHHRKVSDLVEGDWVVKDVKKDGERIVGPEDLGIKKEQIKKLKDSGVKKVWVKEGVPFTISFFAGMVVTSLWSNWFLYFLG